MHRYTTGYSIGDASKGGRRPLRQTVDLICGQQSNPNANGRRKREWQARARRVRAGAYPRR